MKDRFKILLISIGIGALITLVFLFLGFSFKVIGLREYGLVRYDWYGTVDATQSVRTNGNYLVGLDHSMISYTKGFITHKFTLNTLTEDKSMIEV